MRLHTTRSLSLAIMLLFATALACDEEPSSTDKGGGSVFDSEPDNSEPDNSEPDNSMVVAEIPESDVMTEGIFGEHGASVGDSLSGVVTYVCCEDHTYYFQMTAGEVLEIEVKELTGVRNALDIGFYADPDHSSDYEGLLDAVNRNFYLDEGDHRQLFAPVTGEYRLIVGGGSLEATPGLTGFLIQTSEGSYTPVQGALPFDDAFSFEGDLVAVLLEVDAPTSVAAEINGTEGFYQPQAIVWDVDAKELVPAFVDHTGMGSLFSFGLEANTPYHVITDWGVGTDYTLTLDPMDDVEGNPARLIPGEAPISGTLTEGDTDYFSVSLGDGDVRRVEIVADPGLEVKIIQDYPRFEARSVGDVTAIELRKNQWQHGDIEEPVLFVSSASGATGDYTIRVTSVTWEPTAVDLSTPLDLDSDLIKGGHQWMTTDVPAGSFLLFDAVETFETLYMSSYDPRWLHRLAGDYIYGVEGEQPLPIVPVVYFDQPLSDFNFGFRELYFRGGAAYPLKGTITRVSLDDLDLNVLQEEPSAGAQPLGALPVEVTGETSEETDTYSVEVEAGKRYIAMVTGDETDFGSGLGLGEVIGASLLQGIVYGDYLGDGTMEYFVPESSGDLVISVFPACQGGEEQEEYCYDNNYTLRVIKLD